jgi:uncharacterized membrane protein YfcA
MSIRRMTADTLVLAVASIVAGGIASVAGFGIGSILTPTLALWMDGRLAVAVVSIPHLIGTALRFAMVKGRVDRAVMWRFGLASAAGGLTGALFQTVVSGSGLMLLLAVLLLFVAASELTGLAVRMRLTGPAAWSAGVLSGLLGGLVGNQGGIRSAALLGFGLPRDAFVATATAIGLFVDAARLPIYLAAAGNELWENRSTIAIASAGVVAGTLAGSRMLRTIPEPVFRKIVAVLLAILGVALIFRAS